MRRWLTFWTRVCLPWQKRQCIDLGEPAGHDAGLVVVVADLPVVEARESAHHQEDHLADEQAWVEGEVVVAAVVLKFKGEAAAGPVAVGEACVAVLVAFAGSTALQAEEAADVGRHLEDLLGLGEEKLARCHQVGRFLGGVADVDELEGGAVLYVDHQVSADAEVQRGGVEQSLGERLHHSVLLAQVGDLAIGKNHAGVATPKQRSIKLLSCDAA